MARKFIHYDENTNTFSYKEEVLAEGEVPLTEEQVRASREEWISPFFNVYPPGMSGQILDDIDEKYHEEKERNKFVNKFKELIYPHIYAFFSWCMKNITTTILFRFLRLPLFTLGTFFTYLYAFIPFINFYVFSRLDNFISFSVVKSNKKLFFFNDQPLSGLDYVNPIIIIKEILDSILALFYISVMAVVSLLYFLFLFVALILYIVVIALTMYSFFAVLIFVSSMLIDHVITPLMFYTFFYTTVLVAFARITLKWDHHVEYVIEFVKFIYGLLFFYYVIWKIILWIKHTVDSILIAIIDFTIERRNPK